MVVNGVIFQKKNNIVYKGYKGVEGDNWYLNDIYEKVFNKYFEDKIERYWDNEFVEVLYDKSIICKYIELSKKDNIDYRIILCETEKKCPIADCLNWANKQFVGYDYAYSGGTCRYSAVFSDVYIRDSAHKRNIFEFDKFDLNRNGLFETFEEIKEFENLRKKLIQDGKKDLEKGNFIIYKLYDVEGLI